MWRRIYTIGHGNKGLSELVDILKGYAIQTVADIRSYPGSKRNPHFNLEALEASLPQVGVTYEWYKGLGGYRKKGLGAESPHVALKSHGFRNYADHMLTETFKEDVDKLLQLAGSGKTCIMCAETLPFRCHRWLLSDYLVANQVEVIHVIDVAKRESHTLSRYARILAGNILYDVVEGEHDGIVG